MKIYYFDKIHNSGEKYKILIFIFEKRVNCHFGPCGLASFATLVQISNLLHLGPCGLHFVAILVQNPKNPIFLLLRAAYFVL